MSSRLRAPAALALGVAVLSACSGGSAPTTATSAEGRWSGTVVQRGYPLPEQEFTDTDGRPVVPAEEPPAPVTLVFFGYTHCPDICNVVLANLALARRGLERDERRDVRVAFVGTDPARDTPPVVRDYLDRFDDSSVGWVAPVETVERAADALYITYERPDGSTGGATYLVEHGTYVTAFVDGQAKLVWSSETSVADLRSDLRRLVRLTSARS